MNDIICMSGHLNDEKKLKTIFLMHLSLESIIMNILTNTVCAALHKQPRAGTHTQQIILKDLKMM